MNVRFLSNFWHNKIVSFGLLGTRKHCYGPKDLKLNPKESQTDLKVKKCLSEFHDLRKLFSNHDYK